MNKQSIYLPEDILDEVRNEARRQDRSISWIIQRAWLIAAAEIKNYPGVVDEKICA